MRGVPFVHFNFTLLIVYPLQLLQEKKWKETFLTSKNFKTARVVETSI